MRRRIWTWVELAAFAPIAYGTWLLSEGWGFIVGGVLIAVWAATEEMKGER